MKQRLLALLLALILCLALTLPAWAAADDYIVDERGTFNSSSLQKLNAYAAAMQEETGVRVMFLITDDTGGQTMYEVLCDAFSETGDDEGFILGVNTEEEKWDLAAFGAWEDKIDEEAEEDLVDAYDEASTYFDGVLAYLLAAEKRTGGTAVAQAAARNTPVAPTDANGHPLRLVDDADLLSDGEEAALLKKLDSVSQAQQMDVVVITTETLDGKSPTAYADDYYDYNGYGFGSSHDGILLLLSMEDRDWRISTTGAGIHTFTDAGIDYIGEQIVPDLSDGNYAAAFSRFADLCDDFINQAETGEPYDVGSLPKGPLEPYWIAVALVIGLVIAGMVTGGMKNKLKSVRRQPAADSYVRSGSMQLRENRDTFLYTHVSRTLKPQNNSSGGGSSTHFGSSGTSHGGGGGKF